MNFIQNRPDDRKKVKDKKWGSQYVNFIVGQANNSFDESWTIRYRNYRYVNNMLNQKEFQTYCDPFEWDNGKGLDYVQPFNKLHNVINVLRGEELRRLFNYHVVDMSPEATNDRLRAEKRDYMSFIEFQLEKEVSIQKMNVEMQVQAEMAQMQGQDVDPAQVEQMQAELMQELQEKENNIVNLEEIREKYKNYTTAQEKAMGKLLQQFIEHQQIRFKKNIGFYDATVAAVEAVRVELVNGMPTLEVLNPLGLLYHKSPEVEWIQDGDYCAYKREMSVKEVKRIYGDYLTKTDLEYLKSYGDTIYGLDARVNSRDGESPSHFHQLNTTYNQKYYNSQVLHSGGFGYGNANTETFDMCTVYDCYWITEKYVGLWTYSDDYGDPQAEFVDYKFEIPEDAEKFKETDELGITKTYYEWEDDLGPQRLYYTWIPELWRGTQINDRITVKVEPMPEAYQVTPDNPHDIKLPIYGATYNNRNAPFMSVVDYMMPWYKLYLILMSKMLWQIAKDHGGITALNTLFLGDQVDIDKTLQYAVKIGFLPYNPLQNSQGAGVVNNVKAAEYINLSNMQNIQYYSQLAKFIEQEIFKAAGVPEQRLGQTTAGTNVTDNRQDLAQSAYITEPLFYTHELVWEAALQQAVTLLANTADSNHPYVRDILSDDEIAVINMGVITKDSKFRFKISNNGENTRLKQLTEQHLHALIQTDKANLSTFLKLMRKGNITAEMIGEIEAIERNIDNREAMMQQQQQEMQQQQLQAQEAAEQTRREHEITLKQMELESRERVATINTYRYQQDLDVDDNGVNDAVETSLAMKESQQKDRELSIKEQELAMRTKDMQNNKST